MKDFQAQNKLSSERNSGKNEIQVQKRKINEKKIRLKGTSYSPLTYPFYPSFYLPRDDLFISIFRCRKDINKIFVGRTF